LDGDLRGGGIDFLEIGGRKVDRDGPDVFLQAFQLRSRLLPSSVAYSPRLLG